MTKCKLLVTLDQATTHQVTFRDLISEKGLRGCYCHSFCAIYPRRAGARRRTSWPWVFEHPPLTRLLDHAVTRGKRHSKEPVNCPFKRAHSKERLKSWRNCFSHFLGQFNGQVTRGRQRSNFAFSTFFYKLAHTSRTRRATAPRKSANDSSLNTLSPWCPHIWPKINDWLDAQVHKRPSSLMHLGRSCTAFSTFSLNSFCKWTDIQGCRFVKMVGGAQS